MRRAQIGLMAPTLLIAGSIAAAADARPQPGHAASRSLEGLWTNVTATPIERPAEFDGPTTTEPRAKAFEASSSKAFDSAQVDDIGGRQTEWWEYGGPMVRVAGKIHTAIIVDPADGLLPYIPTGRAMMERALKSRLSGFDNPEERPPTERCMMGGSSSSSVPMMPHFDNSHYKIVQTRDAVVIWMESGRDPRIIRLNVKSHLPAAFHPWAGDTIAHWEGRTLVAETTNLNPGEAFRSPQALYISAAAKVTERFTRIAADAFLYSFTVDDPAIYARPWRGELVFHKSKGPIYEFACHEGNYALPGILAGARRIEATGH